MKQRMSNKKTIALFAPFMGLIAIVMAALIVLSVMFAPTISRFLGGIGGDDLSEETLSEGTELVEDIVEEGTVLLKNEDDALPLSADEMTKVNVFGWAAYDWMTSTFGSGYSNTTLTKVKFFDALQAANIQYNTTLYDMYKNFYSATTSKWGMSDLREYRGDVEVGGTRKFVLHEPGADYYTDEIIAEAREFSSVALVVIGRTGGEAADLRFHQEKQVQSDGSSATVTDNTRTYLQLSTEEEEMIAAAKEACDKVIVLLNTSNTMELGFVEDEGIDACLLVGLTGLTGVNAVVDILRGADEEGNAVSPSGRTVDTYAYSVSSAPSSVNSGFGGAKKYNGFSGTNKEYYNAYLDYYEGIYVGYRYYETAAEDGFIDYAQTVQYPFGYGMSYTTFEWSVTDVRVDGDRIDYDGTNELGENSTIEISVEVFNTGDVAGKEVVELYYTAPYYTGEVEKAFVVLGAFAKTGVIPAGESDTVMLELSARDMASYDCYGLSRDNFTGYVLDGGIYTLRLRTDAHTSATMSEESRTGADIEFSVPGNGYEYDTDDVTGNPVENRFTGEDAIDGYQLDGSEENAEIVYLSRAEFDTTFPTEIATRDRNDAAYAIATAQQPTAEQLAATGYADVEEPWTGLTADITLESMLDVEGYDDDRWENFISQLSTDEMFELIRNGYFKTAALPSIEKEEYVDLDGPAGLNTRVTSATGCNFIAYPSETMLGQTWNTDLAYAVGQSVGNEASDANAGIMGWYAPGANIHRNPYGGRNAEYYSEDGLLSGKFAAETIRGAKSKGLYCYMKHFVANDSETLREGLYTFMTEQTLREIYLKPFEIAVKEGGSNAIMTSMNRLGATWAGASYALCTQILREEWGFEGTLVTDWVDTGTDYMPVYKGIWAGNDIWLNNNDGGISKLFDDSLANDDVFVTLAQKVSRNVLWTLIDTLQTADAALSAGTTYDMTWVWYIVAAEVVLAAGLGTLTFFMVRNLLRNKREKDVAQPEDGGADDR